MRIDIEAGIPIPKVTRRGVYDDAIKRMEPGMSVVLESAAGFMQACKRWGKQAHSHQLTDLDLAHGRCKAEQVGKYRVWILSQESEQTDFFSAEEPASNSEEPQFETGEG